MPRFAFALTGARRDVPAPSAYWPESSPLPVWGDGLLEQSLSALWYPHDWDDVSEDELAFLIPSLASKACSSTRQGSPGPSFYLLRALCARIRWVVAVLSPVSADGASSGSKEILEAIERSGAVVTLPPVKAWDEGQEAFHELYGNAPSLHSAPGLSSGKRDSLAAADSDVWTFELAILACLDRLLHDSLQGVEISDPDRDLHQALSLADTLIAAIYSSFNAAYVYPRFAFCHELFTAGAWLGYLVRGRAAMMPVLVAEFIMEQFSRQLDDDGSQAGRCNLLLRFHADLSVGSRRLLKVARRVTARGQPMLVQPAWSKARLIGTPPYLRTRLVPDSLAKRLAISIPELSKC